MVQTLVGEGMRAVLESSSFLTGQKAISMQLMPNAPPATVTKEGDALVMPSQGGGLDNITTSLSDISTKLDRIPFDQIGQQPERHAGIAEPDGQRAGGAECDSRS